jgi:hypothetical protein
VKVALVDVAGRREYISDEIVQTESNSETEIAGAHPNDRDGVKNRSYSQRESSGRQETMAKAATERAASKVAEYMIDASKNKAQE